MVSGTYHAHEPKTYYGLAQVIKLDGQIWTDRVWEAVQSFWVTSFLNEDVTDWIYIENKNLQDGSTDRLSVRVPSPLLSARLA